MTKRIWITRTEPGASRLASKLRESCFDPVTKPVFEILPVHSTKPTQETDLWVFVSGHAVSHVSKRKWDRTKPTIAVGPTTAAQLESMKIHPLVPSRHSSDGIYDLIRSRFAVGLRVTIVAGRDGRKDLRRWLSNDGYLCHEWIVYERKPTKVQIQTSLLDAIIIASGAAISEVRQQFTDTSCVSIPLIVPSPRDAELARSMQFRTILVATGVTDTAIVSTLEHYFLNE